MYLAELQQKPLPFPRPDILFNGGWGAVKATPLRGRPPAEP